jgi:hypothetical protein
MITARNVDPRSQCKELSTIQRKPKAKQLMPQNKAIFVRQEKWMTRG